MCRAIGHCAWIVLACGLATSLSAQASSYQEAARREPPTITDPFSIDITPTSPADGLIVWIYDYHDENGLLVNDYNTGSRVFTPGLELAGTGSTNQRPRHPALSANGQFIAFMDTYDYDPVTEDLTWNPDVALYDRFAETMVALPFNTRDFPEWLPSLSGGGRFIAYATLQGGPGNIKLFDRKKQVLVALPGLNTKAYIETEPSISNNGRYIAFASNRTETFDIFLYDRQLQSLVDLPRLNFKTRDDRMPSISGDANRLAFLARNKNQDTYIRLYDRPTASFVGLQGISEIGSHGDVTQPSLNAASTLIAFEANSEPDEDYHPDVFLYDVTTKSFRAFTLYDAADPAIR